MNQAASERVIYQCKLHWGIFTIPIFFTLAFAIPMLMITLPVLLMLHTIPTTSKPPLLDYFWILAFVPEIIGGFVVFLFALAAYLKSEVVLTESRLIFSTGFFSIGRTEILLAKIETLTLFEPILGRICGYGTVAVTGTGGTVFRLRFLPKPEYLHSLLQTMAGAVHTPRAAQPEYPPNLLGDESRYMPKG